MKKIFTLILAVSCSLTAVAQISFTNMMSSYTENFNTLADTTNAAGTCLNTLTWTDNSTLGSWYVKVTNSAYSTSTVAAALKYGVCDGSGNAGSLYSFGSVNGATDRSLGCLNSVAVGNIHYGVRMINNGTTDISNLNINYTVKQFRQGGTTVGGVFSNNGDTISVAYLVGTNLTDPTAAGFVDVPQLLAPSPNNTNTTTGTKIDGNAAGNFATVSYALPVSIAPGQEFFLRFLDKDDRGSDNAIAVDNLTVAASYSTPTQNRLPKGYALTIAPNPTAHTAQAQMQLPQAENIMVEVYNTLGQKVASSTRSSYAEGANTIAIPTENLINGNYYVRILGDNFAVTQSLAKM